jgi:hypothetical protein
MKRYFTALLAAGIATGPLMAQEAALAPVIAQPRAEAPETALPANTELTLRVNDEVSSSAAQEGDTFALSVVHDVVMNGYVVIPAGSRAVGEVTWKTGKGAFGKSGKLAVELRYVEVGGRRLPIEGKFRQEGEGNTVATVAGVIAVGVFAGFITGKTAVIPRGRELTAHTKEALPVSFVAAPSPSAPTFVGGAIVRTASLPLGQPVVAASAGSDRRNGESCGDYARRVAPGKAALFVERRCEERSR